MSGKELHHDKRPKNPPESDENEGDHSHSSTKFELLVSLVFMILCFMFRATGEKEQEERRCDV